MNTDCQTPSPNPLQSVPRNFRNGARLTWHQRRRRHAVLSLMRGLSGRVLDYGCGYGDLTAAVAKTNDVTGCEVDPQRVAFARREYPDVVFVPCAPNEAPFEDASFDVVMSVVVVHFVPDPGAYLREVRRVLRPRGHLLIVCKNQPVVRNAVRRTFGRPKSPSRLWVPPMADQRALLAREGFDVVRSTYFYDPPFEGWRNPGDWLFGTAEQFLSLARIRATAGYHAFLTRCSGR